MAPTLSAEPGAGGDGIVRARADSSPGRHETGRGNLGSVGSMGTRGKYDAEFYAWQAAPARASAAVMVPLLLEAVGTVRSVLDVGCGMGAWLAEWERAGVEDFFGVDGDYVDRVSLLVPPERFEAHDLSEPLDLGRRFDLVTSFEVAEHLPEDKADQFVASLVRHADVVAFSAAIPGQGGVGHVNEQWQSYWARKFDGQGLEPHDDVRWKAWDNPAVEFWYAQNTVLYARPGTLASEPSRPFDVAHPGYEEHQRMLPMKWKLWEAMPEGFRKHAREVRRKLPI